ncbi:MAG: hypothetical protein CL910_04725 [Deltaproteobacteria bacterium]|nr:hypothetical protein [Deltaproteobacteria bacterium]
MRRAMALLASLLCGASLAAAAPPKDRVTNPKPALGGAPAEKPDIPVERVPESIRGRRPAPVPQKPEPGLRPEPRIEKPSLGARCGPGVWPLHFEFSADPLVIWPGDTLVLRWRTVGAGNTQWRDPVHLTNGATGRREAVAAVSTLRIAGRALHEPETTFALETTCKRKELRVAVAPAPNLTALAPSPYVCRVQEGPDDCPGTLELRGRDFGARQLPGAAVSLWLDPAYRFALRVRSWSDGRILVEMPSEMRNGRWYVQVSQGMDRSRRRDSAARSFEVEYQARAPVVEGRPAPRPGGFGGGARVSGGGSDPEDESCDEGAACTVEPRACSGRPGFEVAGTVRCRSGRSECVASEGVDYCSSCGGICGGCSGDSCSETSHCAPGSICRREHGPTGSANRCASIRDTSVPFSQPCTHIGGFCWTPDELGTDASATMICSEAR